MDGDPGDEQQCPGDGATEQLNLEQRVRRAIPPGGLAAVIGWEFPSVAMSQFFRSARWSASVLPDLLPDHLREFRTHRPP